MDQTHDYEIACERYLLGELSEQEQTQLEAQYFEDDELFERFLAVKDDLVDAYAVNLAPKSAISSRHIFSPPSLAGSELKRPGSLLTRLMRYQGLHHRQLRLKLQRARPAGGNQFLTESACRR